jgi:eukaryotic-like serine/threonine-protein kinase
MKAVGVTGQQGSQTNDDPTVVHEGTAIASDSPEQGAVLGRYVVVEVLGEGGMGRVLRAYDPKLKREVALKLLRFEGDASARARLIAEAQSMARLSHPNVLPVYDYDFDFDGNRPFIAMEYVEGTTLRQWLEDHHPSRAEIVEAFLAAGAGLAAAHAAGLVHCDFKPSNVLRGTDGRIRVMDFGLASVTLVDPRRSREGGGDERSQHAGLMGTPSYMAPEQHAGGVVDARSDQYAFAVSLWEVLHGQRPFIGSSVEELATAKLQRKLETTNARAAVPGSLRRVLLRGLAPDPRDRFGSMEAMLTELRKDPVRSRRIAIVLGLAVAGIGGLKAWSMQREAAREAACRERGDEIRASWGPEAARAVEAEFQGATPTYAADTFARTSPWLDRYADQWALLRTDLCLRPAAGAEDERLRAAAASCLDERRAELEALVDLLRRPDVEVIAMAVPSAAGLSPLEPCGDAAFLTTMPSQPTDEAAPAALSELRRALAEVDVLGQAGRYDAAGARIEAALREAEALAYEPLVAETHLLAARVARFRGRYPESRRHAEQAFELAATFGFDDTTASAAAELADLVGVTLAEHEVGLLWARFGITVIERRAWEERPIHAQLLGARGRILSQQAEYEEATAAYDQALRIESDALGANHPRIADSWSNLGSLAEQMGDHDAAIDYHQRALALRESMLGAHHPKVAESLNNLGNAHWGRGELELATEKLQRAARIKIDAYGPDHYRVSSTLQNLGNVLYSQGQAAEAIGNWEQSLRILDGALPEAHPERASVLGNLAAGHMLVGALEPALDHARRAVDVSERVHGAEHISLAGQWRILGAVHQQRGEYAEAVRCLRRELAIVRAVHGDSHLRAAEAHRELGKLLVASGDRAAAMVELELAAAVLGRVNASSEAKALVDVQILAALDPEDPATAGRTKQLATSAYTALCGGEAPAELCAELGTKR